MRRIRFIFHVDVAPSSMSPNAPALSPPSDPSITSFWVGGIQDSSITEGDIRAAFHAYGELVNVVHVPAKNCAFVTFQRRAGAEEAAKKLHNNLKIKGTYLKLAWVRTSRYVSACHMAYGVDVMLCHVA